MLLTLLPLLLVAENWKEAPIETRHPEAIKLFQSDFEEASDTNYDQWPDEWTRRTGAGYPNYLDIEITDENSGSGKHALRMKLDGGSATIYSPPIAVRDIFSYVLEGRIQTKDLEYDRGYVSLTFFDKENKAVKTYYSHKFRETGGWVKFRIGPISPEAKGLELAVIGLHIGPQNKTNEDLVGEAWFDDIWFARLPKMTLATQDGASVYQTDQEIEVVCNVSGILEKDPAITFELVDVGDQSLAKFESQLDGRVVARKTENIQELFGKKAYVDENWSIGYAGTIKWSPPIAKNGFYQVRATMAGSEGLMHRRSMTMAVVSQDEMPTDGQFGWSLPEGELPLDFPRMFDLLTTAGVNWVKFPVWYSENDLDRANNIARFAERLEKHNIMMVAVIDKPPQDIRALFGEQETLLVANVFAEPLLWRPYIEPILTRLSLTVHYWQLGADDDVSFVGYRNLGNKLNQIRSELQSSGQDIRFGLPWRWMADAPQGTSIPFEFLAYSILPADGDTNKMLPLTKDELAAYLESTKDGTRRFATIYPLPRSKYTTDERARDLVEKMVMARIHDADAAFIPQPFDREFGLMNEDGSPSELLLPWRTTARMISGSDYLGTMQLPMESDNYVFSRSGKTTMLIWNAQPATEKIYLGEDVTVVDLWGRETTPLVENGRQVIEVGPIPQFVQGLNEGVTKLRLSFEFDPPELGNNFGQTQRISAKFTNSFPAGVSGSAKLITPEVWNVSPRSMRFKLTRSDTQRSTVHVLLRSDASSGTQPVRIDFELQADQNYRFSVFRKLQVGSGMIKADSTSTIDDETGDLLVEVNVQNLDQLPISFDGLIYATGRRQMRQRVMNMATGRTTLVYRIPEGKRLIGTTILLRLKEIGGTRVFNHRIDVVP